VRGWRRRRIGERDDETRRGRSRSALYIDLLITCSTLCTFKLQFFIAQLFLNAPPACEPLARPGSPHSVDPNGAEGFLSLRRRPQADLEADTGGHPSISVPRQSTRCPLQTVNFYLIERYCQAEGRECRRSKPYDRLQADEG
jgi:hypothetical protein